MQLSELSRRKGEFESYISQIESAEKAIKEKCEEMNKIDDGLFSEDFAQRLEAQRDKFNKIFSEVSHVIYDEQYIISYEVDTQKGSNCISSISQMWPTSVRERNRVRYLALTLPTRCLPIKKVFLACTLSLMIKRNLCMVIS